MYKALILGTLLSVAPAIAQTASAPAPGSFAGGSELSSGSSAPDSSSTPPSPQAADDLPDAPSALGGEPEPQLEDVVVIGEASLKASGKGDRPCNAWRAMRVIYVDPNKADAQRPACSELVYPYQRFLNTDLAIPLSWQQKGYLALHYSTDPASLGTIAGVSAINIASDPDTAYGPGLKGFGKLAGISMLQNATAEFFGTFAVPSLVHQDPRYYRMRDRPVGRRILYAITRSYVSRSDTGKTIPNYGTLAAYPIVAELSNLYVPGIQSDGASTAERIATGLALDPVNNLVNEFLPDVARHIHVRIIFVQQILNNIAASQGGMP
ncbi:MAG: hypothetical protein JSS95_11480 [Acidobacteria bacterium]|nr:hypothetical protein [Acidobacteriota bacterium]